MKIDLKEIRTIPNILTLIRLASVPVFMFFVIFGGFTKDLYVYVGLGIFLLAASTDLFDGAIARKYNQVTNLGKFLDPFADKVMHVGVLLSLVIIGYVHWIFIALLALKELTMVICGYFLVSNKIVLQANSMGKIASFTLSVGVMASFFHKFFVEWGIYAHWIVLGIGIVLTYIAFVIYGVDALKDFKRIKQQKLLKEEQPEEQQEVAKQEDNAGNE